MKTFLSAILTAVAFQVFCPVTLYAADIDTVRKQVIAFYTAEGANRADARVAASLSSLDSSAETALSTCLPNGSWSDVDYHEVPVSSWGLPPAHYGRILTMAQAYFTEGIPLYRQDTLLRKIADALTYVQSYVYEGVTKSHWWWYTIGLPNYLSPILLLVQGHIDSSVFNTSLATLNYLINGAPVGTGANLVWESMNHLHYALITHNTLRLGTVRTNLASVCITHPATGTSGEGIKPDFSFHQHGAQLQTGHYGGSFAVDVARYFLFVHGTPYEVPATNSETFFKYILNGTRWAVYGNCWDPSVRGRSIVRSYSTYASEAFYALLMMSAIPGAYRDTLTASAKKMLESWPYGISSQYAGMITPVKTSSVPPAFPYGVKHYNESDYMISRGLDYFMSVKMHSSRMIPAELVNDEGKKSWHLSDGMTYLTVKGDEYYLNNVRPVLDWYRLPGTTVERKYRAAGAGYSSYGTRAFVGGLHQGHYGVSAMDFDANASDLTALKSWFFFNGIMVCLGSDIACPNANRVETIVNQAPLSSESAPIYSDGIELPTSMGWTDTLANVRWVHCDSIGYYFFQNTSPVILKKAVQSGTWSSLAGGASETVCSAPIYTLWFDHGTNALRQKYAYAVFPAVSRTDMADFSETVALDVLANNDSIHGVRANTQEAVGVVFWKPGSIDNISVDCAAVVFYRSTADSLFLSACYPPHSAVSFNVSVHEALEVAALSSGMSVSATSGPTIVSVNADNGLTYTARFARAAGPKGRIMARIMQASDSTPLYAADARIVRAGGFVASRVADIQGDVSLSVTTGIAQLIVSKPMFAPETLDVNITGGDTVRCNFYLTELPVSGIRIQPDSLVLHLNDTATLNVFSRLADGYLIALNEPVAWLSRSPDLFTVDSLGVLSSFLTAGNGFVCCSSRVNGYVDS
ncbi:MAG: polysaccharide lyase family 8 super-sandwich domain-containing protein, partial [Fibrobacterota bacterium]